MKKIHTIIALALIALASCAGPRANTDSTEASQNSAEAGAMIHGAPESN
jgi:hypothetical protein